MNTVIRDWFLVSVFDASDLVERVLCGYVIYDARSHYLKDDFICTSNIIHINSSNQLITTDSGNLYQTIEKGRHSKIYLEEFELLRIGFNPLQIEALRISPVLKIH
ncbi:hypothetical protein [Colwellia sp. MB3u-4]|uniref:hypothetical protein n=1 Tax=Colwellia sp. MB3u-4 TaxID=2759822 RepID=UPI0015F4F7CF|nr:hypothetical protein [Colwellia sp. MB3u-4]MBA6288576.1 hypothetical protein [Colwellia sp. MB3u-4]